MSGSTARTGAKAAVSKENFLDRCITITVKSVQIAAFWGAVCMPVAYVAALHEAVAGQQTQLFFVLLLVNVICAVIGHGHSPYR